MKSLKLLLASLLVAGALQANEHRHNNVAYYVAGLVSGVVILDALSSRHDVRPVYRVYNDRAYYRDYYSHKKHYKKHHKDHHKSHYYHKKHNRYNPYYSDKKYSHRNSHYAYRDDYRRK